jgi:hypothetical protein
MSVIYINPYSFAATDPNFADVSLLLHGDGTNGSTVITDNSPSPKTVTAVGNAQISTAQSKFGGASIAFDGTGDYLNVSGGFVSGTEDFTIEWWEKLNTINTNYPLIRFDNDAQSGIKTGANGVQFYHSTNQLNILYPYTSSSDWQHVAISRGSGTVRMFASGILLTNPVVNVGQNYSFNVSSFAIGRAWSQFYTNDFAGYIDDFRITKGIARYTANFTPPTAAFPDI